MKTQTADVRRRHQERKRQRKRSEYSQKKPVVYHESGERDDHLSVYHPRLEDSHNRGNNRGFVRKQWIVFRVMIAAVLFLAVGVMFKSPAPVLEDARGFVKNTFQNEFQFAMVGDWYQKQFGEPLALFPKLKDKGETKVDTEESPNYAEPVSGTVTKDFADTEKGITIQTKGKEPVKAVKQGMVNFVGTDTEHPELGKIVKVGHPDGTESWYGKLENVNVKLYDFVKGKEKIGTVTPSKDGKSGTFYFALKKGDTFINPIQVISFD